MAILSVQPLTPSAGDERFFLRASIFMTVVIVAGFSLHLAMGRSTFSSPLRVHVHAVLFMGWVGIYLLQNIFAATGRIGQHRKLGWIAVVWMAAMIVSGLIVTVVVVRAGTVPFFFQPLHFLIFDPVSLITFGGLTASAVLLRRRTEWHRRLHFCGMTILLAPAFGRLLPLPLMQPWSWEAAFMVTLLFPLTGMWYDTRRTGRVHAAWRWGLSAIAGSFLLTQVITYSSIGTAIYVEVTEGSPGAAVPPLEFPPPPNAPLSGGVFPSLPEMAES